MKAIIISGLPAAGKTTVAKILAKKIGVEVVGGGDILKEMAKERGYYVTGNEWWDTDEGMRFLKEREINPDFDKEADHRLKKKITQGNVVITSYTMPWLTKDGLKVWLAASTDKRAGRMSDRDNSDLPDALKTTKKRDRENEKLYKDMYNINLGKDLTPFELIIDTDNISAEEVASKILAKMKELKIED